MTNQSEMIDALAGALSKAQGEMQAAIKDSINPFFKSKYADLGSVWDAARPVLSKNGLCVMQYTDVVDSKIMLVTMLAHSSGQWIKSFLPLNPSKADSQGVGAAITYMRRYGLSALVGVVCDDDDDGEIAVGRGTQEVKERPQPKTQSKPKVEPITESKKENAKPLINEEQLSVLNDTFDQCTEEYRKTFKNYMQQQWNINGFMHMNESQFRTTIQSMNNHLSQQTKVS